MSREAQAQATAPQQRYLHHLRHYSDIQQHLPRLYEEARGAILELGVRGGVSTSAFLAGVEAHGGEVWSVDIDQQCASVFFGHPQWHFICADSRDVAALRASGVPDRLDVLFVDTVHTFEQVEAELAAWGSRVKEDGVMLLHDTESSPGVRAAALACCRRNTFAVEFLSGSHGLGVIHPGRKLTYLARAKLRLAPLEAWLRPRARHLLRLLRRS